MKETKLIVRKHNKTGLLYFHKTVRLKQLDTYLGSGTYWVNHLNKYGKDVSTLWISESFFDENEIKNFALQFSEDHDIVNSKRWANLIPETGLSESDGSQLNTKNSIAKRTITLNKKEVINKKNQKRNKTLKKPKVIKKFSESAKNKWKDEDYRNKSIESRKGNTNRRKRIKTPDGIFESLKDAAEFYNIVSSTVYNYLKIKNGWEYL